MILVPIESAYMPLPINFGPISHRFWDTATYWLKIAHFSYPSVIRRPRPMFPFAFRSEVNQEETTVMGWKLHDSNFNSLWPIKL